MTESAALARVLAKLDRVRQRGDQYDARCPAHDDRKPSLSVSIGREGQVILRCFGGCDALAVIQALGLSWDDLYDRSEFGGRLLRYQYEGVPSLHIRKELPNGKKGGFRWEPKFRDVGVTLKDVPLYCVETLVGVPLETRVYLVEGEKACESLIARGLVAVATAGTAHKPSLEPLRGRSVALWPDNEAEGLRHMQALAGALAGLQTRVAWVVWPEAPEHGDAADFVGDAAAVEALVVETPVVDPFSVVEIIAADDLMVKTFRTPRWAIPDVLPEGLTILGGRPKMGKSWLGLDWAVDIARSGAVMRRIGCEGGEVLYLALEDGPRRIQERLQLVLGEASAPPGLFVSGTWPLLNTGGLELLEAWLAQHPGARAVFIDTFKRVRGDEDSRKRLYDLDYDSLAPLQALALRRGVAIVVVFHTRKGESDDPLELISGTLGLTGVADGILVLRRERGQADASLFVTGRDVEERDLALKFHGRDSDRFGWEWLGNAEDFRLSKQRYEILETLQSIPGARPSEIAGAIGKSVGSVRYLLFKMVRDREVRVRDGQYYPAIEITAIRTNANAANATPGQSVRGLNPAPNAVRGVRGDDDIPSDSSVIAKLPLLGRTCTDCGCAVERDAKRCAACFRVWSLKEDRDAPF